jgi:hypothetical protein
MPKITPRKTDSTVIVKTSQSSKTARPEAWWRAKSKQEQGLQLISTASFLKEQQQYRYRQAALYARLYSNYPLFGWVGSNLTKASIGNQLPSDRPTLNVVQSCIDTLVSRITQSRPRPMFLTDGGDYKQRNLAKQMNNFIQGEFYQTKAYEHGERCLRDASILGSGIIKVLEKDDKVCLERRLLTELLVDPNDALYGCPRQLYELQLVDREVLMELFPGNASIIEKAEQAYPDSGGDASKTIADQVMLIEGWRLPSGPEAGDGMHAIACSSGTLISEAYEKHRFPFVMDHYSQRVLGLWGQGLAEQLMGTQTEINKLLMTISASINLVGVPRVFVDEASKVVSAHLNNQIGAIVKYRGTKPVYEVAPCVPAEVYEQLQRLVGYAYQQSGISALAATSQKPAGLNSGEAIRNYDDLQSDRFTTTSKSYERVYEDLAYLIFDTAKDIAKRTGKYQTVYPGKDGTKKIDLPNLDLLKDDFVIQCYDVSSLPKDPAGRLQKITEMIQAGMIDIREGRRLLDFPDLEQVEKLANACEERILQALDKIVEEGEYTPPDPFMDPELAYKLAVQYYNLYAAAKLEEEKQEKIRTFASQCQALMQASQPPQQPMMAPQAGPVGVPQARPTSDLMPLTGGAA